MSDVVRFGVIGVGAIGRIHADNLAHRVSGASLVAVADLSRDLAEDCAAANGAEDAFTSDADLLALGKVDAVVIATPPETHAAIIEKAAAADKQIVCEKPLERTLEDADRAIAAVERAGVRLFVAFNRRYDPHYLRLREAVNEGRIGRPLTVRLVARDPVEWMPDAPRPAGDLFLSTTIHDLDFAGFLMNDRIESVFAIGGVTRDGPVIDDPDTAATTLQFAGGAHGVIETSRVSSYGYDQRVEVLGDKGMMAVPNPLFDSIQVTDATGAHANGPAHSFAERYRESYVAEMTAFTRSILDGAPSPISTADARTAQALCHAAHQSYIERRPVNVDEFA